VRRLAPWLVGLVLGLAVVTLGPDVVRARPRATHTAGVTVAYGDGRVVRRTASFTRASISGIEALQVAGFDIEVYGYGGLGAAVCRIDGVGRDADASCLNGGANYWAYWRNGTYSSVGAGATRVSDGDQEQWAWGSGTSAPPTTGFPTTTTVARPPPATDGPGEATDGPVATTAAAGPGRAGGSSTTGPSSTSSTDGATDRTSTSVTTTEPAKGREDARSSPDEEDDEGGEAAARQLTSAKRSGDGGSDGGSPLALGGFAVVLAAVVGLTVKARSARGSAPPRN
jgi:hypothetical protein